MAYRARVVSQWQKSFGRNEMKVSLDHPWPGVAYTDVTGQPDANIPPAPNALVIEVDPLDDTQLAALEADAGCIVLWSEVIS